MPAFPIVPLFSRVAWLLALSLIAGPGHAATPATDKPVVAAPDCEQARRLPPGANDDARRIACAIPGKYQHDVSMAEFVGRLIRLHDVAAWRTTDALLESGAFRSVPGEGRGWLTHARGNAVEVRYFTQDEGLVAFAAAELDMDTFKAARARRLSPVEPATAWELRLIAARDSALATPDLSVCTNHTPNVVVIESEEAGVEEILVFVMSAWKDDDQAPLGGFHMFRYSPDGQTQLSRFSQTRSFPVVNLHAPSQDGAQAAGLGVTHLTSATPTMFHVFLNLQYGQPLFVVTAQNGLHWRVEDGRIHLIHQEAKPLEAAPTDTGNNAMGAGADTAPAAKAR